MRTPPPLCRPNEWAKFPHSVGKAVMRLAVQIVSLSSSSEPTRRSVRPSVDEARCRFEEEEAAKIPFETIQIAE